MGAVVVVAQGEPGLLLRGLLLLVEQVGLVGLGRGGVDDLQDPAGQDAQVLGVVVGGQGEQVLLALLP